MENANIDASKEIFKQLERLYDQIWKERLGFFYPQKFDQHARNQLRTLYKREDYQREGSGITISLHSSFSASSSAFFRQVFYILVAAAGDVFRYFPYGIQAAFKVLFPEALKEDIFSAPALVSGLKEGSHKTFYSLQAVFVTLLAAVIMGSFFFPIPTLLFWVGVGVFSFLSIPSLVNLSGVFGASVMSILGGIVAIPVATIGQFDEVLWFIKGTLCGERLNPKLGGAAQPIGAQPGAKKYFVFVETVAKFFRAVYQRLGAIIAFPFAVASYMGGVFARVMKGWAIAQVQSFGLEETIPYAQGVKDASKGKQSAAALGTANPWQRFMRFVFSIVPYAAAFAVNVVFCAILILISGGQFVYNEVLPPIGNFISGAVVTFFSNFGRNMIWAWALEKPNLLGFEAADEGAGADAIQNKASYKAGQVVGHVIYSPFFVVVTALTWTVRLGVYIGENVVIPGVRALLDNVAHHFRYFVNVQLLLLSPENAKVLEGRGPTGMLNSLLWVVSGVIGLSASLVFLPLLAVGTVFLESWVWLKTFAAKAFKLFAGVGADQNVGGEGEQEKDILGLNDALIQQDAGTHLVALFASSLIPGEKKPRNPENSRSHLVWFVSTWVLGSPGWLLGGVLYALAWATAFAKEVIIGELAHVKDAFLIVSAELTKSLLSPSLANDFNALGKDMAAPPYNVASFLGAVGAMLVVGVGVSLLNAVRCVWYGNSVNGGEKEGESRPWLGRNSGLIVVAAGLLTPAYLFFGGLAFLTGPLGLGLLAGVGLLFILPSIKEKAPVWAKTLNKVLLLASSVGIGVVFFIALTTLLAFPPATAIGLAALATVLSLATHVGLENFGDFFEPVINLFSAVAKQLNELRTNIGASGIKVRNKPEQNLNDNLQQGARAGQEAGAGGFRRPGEEDGYLRPLGSGEAGHESNQPGRHNHLS